MLIFLCAWSTQDKTESEAPHKGLWISGRGICPVGDDSPSLPVALRRRLSPLGKLAMTELYEIQSHLAEEQSSIPWVTSCRHGDSSRMMSLLTNIETGEQLSPMDFSLSVHNAIIGMFSIATKNTQSHTALSGGKLSFEMGLLEAYALQKTTKKPVGYLYYDTTLPTFYNKEEHNGSTQCCLSMVISNENEGTKGLQVEFIPHEDSRQEELTTDLDEINGAYKVTEFLKNNQQQLSILIPGGTFLFEKNE